MGSDLDEALFPATRANDLELMSRRRPGGQVVGPGARDYNMSEIERMLRFDPDADEDYWFDDDYQTR